MPKKFRYFVKVQYKKRGYPNGGLPLESYLPDVDAATASEARVLAISEFVKRRAGNETVIQAIVRRRKD